MKTTRQKILEQQSLNRKIWAKDNGKMHRIDANKLIAEFMGDYNFEHTEGGLPIGDFSNPWAWLMPVAESCLERLDARDTSADNIKKNMISCDKRGLYNAVVEFINWYNKNK